jgi:hypothetical protein
MADRLTKQPLTINSLNIHELNDVLRRIQTELDRLNGLQGTITVYDSLHIEDDNGQVLHGAGAQP